MSFYSKRLGVISLKQKIENPSETEFEHLYQAIGLNTGNFMFTNAIFRHLDGDLVRIGFAFDPKQINREFDALVVPAANWINNKSDWAWLVTLLEKVDIPIITIGIGLQAESMDISKVRVNDSSMRLVKLLSRKAKYISCRGDFTRDWLLSVGVSNVITTGCPSIYMRLKGVARKGIDSGSVVFQSTRYWLSGGFVKENSINRRIYTLAGKLNLPMIYQSEPEEIDYLVYSSTGRDQHAKPKMAALMQLYGFDRDVDMKQYLSNKGNVFFDVDQWSGYVQENIGVIGTRLHGAIVALNSNRPARLLSHDSRTQEVADFAGIPTLNESEFANASEEEMVSILRDTDMSEFIDRKKRSATIYRHFLEECGLHPNYDEIISGECL